MSPKLSKKCKTAPEAKPVCRQQWDEAPRQQLCWGAAAAAARLAAPGARPRCDRGRRATRSGEARAAGPHRRQAERATAPELLALELGHSFSAVEVPGDWTCANVTPIHKKGRRRMWGTTKVGSMTLVPGKAME